MSADKRKQEQPKGKRTYQVEDALEDDYALSIDNRENAGYVKLLVGGVKIDNVLIDSGQPVM
jgi:hypothetical protein